LFLHHLRTVTIVVAWCHEFRHVFLLVKLLLEKGRMLEKIVINAQRGNDMVCPQKELLRMAQKFRSLPRISPSAVVTFSVL